MALTTTTTGPIPPVPTGLSPLTASLLESGKYSDLTIKCGGKIFKVHRSVVCLQSKPFAAHVDQAWREAETGEIDLPDDDREILERFLRFLYTSDYCDNRKIATATTTRSTEVTQTIPGIPQALLTNTKVYIMADKYDVLPLKQLAADKFSEVLPDEGGTKSLPASLELMFDQTPEEDRLLKNIAINYAAGHYKELASMPEFEELCREDGDIAFEIMKAAANDAGWAPRTLPKCNKCSSDFNVSTTSQATIARLAAAGKPRTTYYCQACKSSFN